LDLEKYIRQGSIVNKQEILACSEEIVQTNKIDKIGNNNLNCYKTNK